MQTEKMLRTSSQEFDKFTKTWQTRSRVKNLLFPENIDFDPKMPDFLIELMPCHQYCSSLDIPQRQIALTCGFLAYNEKTLCLERKVLLPACEMINKLLPNIDKNYHINMAINQTLVDESFHILMVEQTSFATRLHREIINPNDTKCSFVQNMINTMSMHQEHWKKNIILVAAAIVTETMICNHLRMLSDTSNVQPIHVITTKAHLMDESCHAQIFKLVLPLLYKEMLPKEKHFFINVLYQSAEWFNAEDNDLLIDLCEKNGLEDFAKEMKDNKVKYCQNDYNELNNFLKEVDIKYSAR